MALKTLIQFPIFAPPDPHPRHSATEIRFSRWNNANAEKFTRRERTQKQIEDQLRFHKRFDSANRIANIHENATATTTTFKSTGTPSTPSNPSIPGKSSKYSKNPRNGNPHPAFQRILKSQKVPKDDVAAETGVKIGENGVSYLVPEAPFEFQYSYTETPKAKPLRLREPPVAPFGPSTMPRPWTGRKPLPPSKKELPPFDSFQLPPPHKKGVKPVQAPGPFLPGSGPKYVRSREELLGEPLSKEEVDELVKGTKKSKRQLNMGRDGLTHNMLDNIHALWKRRRVCKIKCKGVCTVDMENVREQLEEKTGGKIIYSQGGVVYLFRGRNYNYRTRPHYPLMLWRPITPVYPRLIQRTPEGLTLDEASEMRKKGRKLTPICKLGKNGVYCDLVKNVREAFEACKLVRINCQGMNGSDYRKIGAKLKELVPCVLISFEHEHILMWRGLDWKSSLPEPIEDPEDVTIDELDDAVTIIPPLEGQALSVSCPASLNTSMLHLGSQDLGVEGGKDLIEERGRDLLSDTGCVGEDPDALTKSLESTKIFDSTYSDDDDTGTMSVRCEQLQGSSDDTKIHSEPTSVVSHVSKSSSVCSPSTDGVVLLWKQAVEGGCAVVLDDYCLDSDIVYEKAVALAQSAPSGPVFRHRPKKVAAKRSEIQETGESQAKEIVNGSERKSDGSSSRIHSERGFREDYLNVVPRGSLGVDELAKLLA
ncbi:hypothetical protein RJ640_027424 [Escallonia rubra]|uniref:CRM domain-containing protein n=1 Tax=Escallonia rubra TaxID=112253 RepID=A0AA88UCR3_9ASTE|nr:hypothetical protein RJ640_027424 [Escallonia rubra]